MELKWARLFVSDLRACGELSRVEGKNKSSKPMLSGGVTTMKKVTVLVVTAFVLCGASHVRAAGFGKLLCGFIQNAAKCMMASASARAVNKISPSTAPVAPKPVVQNAPAGTPTTRNKTKATPHDQANEDKEGQAEWQQMRFSPEGGQFRPNRNVLTTNTHSSPSGK